MSASPALGADGRLTNPVALVSGGSATPPGGDQCNWVLAAGGAQRPQETPGTYYWQVWRFCTGCESGYEVGPVRTLTLLANAKLELKPPKTVYAGYPFILDVTTTGVPNFTALSVLAGSAKVGAGTVTSDSAAPTVTLSRTAKLHAAVTIGSQTVSSPEVSVKAAKAKTWKTKASDDGTYKGTRSSKLKVAKKGKEIRVAERERRDALPDARDDRPVHDPDRHGGGQQGQGRARRLVRRRRDGRRTPRSASAASSANASSAAAWPSCRSGPARAPRSSPPGAA